MQCTVKNTQWHYRPDSANPSHLPSIKTIEELIKRYPSSSSFWSHETSPIIRIGKPAPPIQCQLRLERWQLEATHCRDGWGEGWRRQKTKYNDLVGSNTHSRWTYKRFMLWIYLRACTFIKTCFAITLGDARPVKQSANLAGASPTAAAVSPPSSAKLRYFRVLYSTARNRRII